MNTQKLVSITLCLLAWTIYADTNGIALTLRFEHTEMRIDEWFDYSITISNGSSQSIQIMKDPKSMILCQMIFDLGTKKEYRNSHYSFDDGWDKRKAFRASRRNAVSLPPSESYTWDILYGYSDLHGAIQTFGITNMSVRCLLGTNEWVRSNTVSLSFHSDDDKAILFEPPDDGKIQEGEEFDSRLYKIKVGDKFYLFNSLRQRICELPSDDLPSIQYDSGKDIVSISFPKGKRTILYNPRTAKVIHEQDSK